MTDTAAGTTGRAPTWRIAPSLPVAIGVFIAYIVVFNGLTAASGLSFDDRFSTGANAFRAAVIPLLGGCLVLILFLLWARWDFVFKDPERLPMRPVLSMPVVLYIVAIVVQFAVVDWSKAPDRLLAVVGDADLDDDVVRPVPHHQLVRRLGHRQHADAMLPGGRLGRAVLPLPPHAGLLVMAMLAHGLWDMSLFLPAPSGALINADRVVLVVIVISAVVATISILRRDRSLAVTRGGVRTF